MNTGQKALMFTKCHGNEEITSLSFDGTYKKLVTGARDGTVKVRDSTRGIVINEFLEILKSSFRLRNELFRI